MMSKIPIFGLLLATTLLAANAPAEDTRREAQIALGERLFHDTRFDNPEGDMETSCASCHMLTDPLGYRAFTERLSKSWHPFRVEEPSREVLRNTPTILDLADHDFIHFDGEFSSLQEQSEITLTSRNFGWLESEKSAALAYIAAAIRTDGASPSYAELLKQAYGFDTTSADPTKLPTVMGEAIAAFMRTLKSPRDSAYDVFVAENGIESAPAPGESPAAYGSRILDHVERAYRDHNLFATEGFDSLALDGYKIFLRTSGTKRAGNCVACHVPPSFTDATFHNVGVTQDAYDTAHGTGSFEALEIPAKAERPAKSFHSAVNRRKPGLVDLGHWNFARAETSPLHRESDTQPEFLARCVATFKTPTLRNLAATDPYGHTGLYITIEAAIFQKVEAAFFARMGQLRNPDSELANIHISEDDIPALFAFLNTLNDNGRRVATPQPIRKSTGAYSGRYNGAQATDAPAAPPE